MFISYYVLYALLYFLFREFEERLEFYKSENLSLQHRVNKLETTLPRQNHIKQSGNQRNLERCNKNSPDITQEEDVYSQVINLIFTESIIIDTHISFIFVNKMC